MTASIREHRAPAFGIYEPLRSVHDAMTGFLELRLLDPLTFSVLELQSWHIAMIDMLVAANDDKPGLKLESRVQEFGLMIANSKISGTVQYGDSPGVLLPATLERFDQTVKAAEAIHRNFTEAAIALEIEPKSYESLTAGARGELALFSRRRSLLTSESLELQTHLEHFLSFGHPTRTIQAVGVAEVLYRPLTILRDEYFTSPKSGVLQCYLAVTASIESSSKFEQLVTMNRLARTQFRSPWMAQRLTTADERLPELTLALEVSALMNESGVNSA